MDVMPARTVDDVFEAFGGPSAFSREFDLKGTSTGSEMKRRGRISIALWPRIVALAAERDISWLTYECLVLMHAQKALQTAGADPS